MSIKPNSGTALKKAVIFGASGQDGYYLSEACRKRGIQTLSTGHRIGNSVCDVSKWDQVLQVISEFKPDAIFHLAAHSTTAHAALFENHEAIATGTLNILEAAWKITPQARIFVAGSGVQFKNIGEPIKENDTFDATSPYAISRIHATYAARYYRTLGLKAYVGYLFHHESPRRGLTHTSKMISEAVRRIARGSQEQIELGDITVEKEWSFAGDIVEAILTLVKQDEIYECVIGSGKAYSIQDWLDTCFGIFNLDWREHVHLKKSFIAEYKRLVSNPETIHRLGWVPVIGFEELAKLMVCND